jgi:FtsH-binding integral membrane protein
MLRWLDAGAGASATQGKGNTMSDFDRSATPRWGRVARAGYAQIDEGLRAYMLGVYNHMILGLAITGLAAIGVHMVTTTTDPTLAVARLGSLYVTSLGYALYVSPLRWVVMLLPLAFVFLFSFRLDRMSAASARGIFIAFAAAMGVSMSWIFLVFTQASIAQVFFITAAAFGSLSLYGYTTKRDLSPIGAFLVMGLWGLIIAMLVNLFLQSSGLQWALSIISVGIFAGLTAWDTQAIKEMYYEADGYEVAAKKSIFGALRLYLDFINLFQSLLYLMGNRNQ